VLRQRTKKRRQFDIRWQTGTRILPSQSLHDTEQRRMTRMAWVKSKHDEYIIAITANKA
jgi:hypothetical protein